MKKTFGKPGWYGAQTTRKAVGFDVGSGHIWAVRTYFGAEFGEVFSKPGWYGGQTTIKMAQKQGHHQHVGSLAKPAPACGRGGQAPPTPSRTARQIWARQNWRGVTK